MTSIHRCASIATILSFAVLSGCTEEDALGASPGGGNSGGGFSVTQGNGTVVWSAPTQREDTPPTALPSNEIAGYRVYYGVETGNYQDALEITGSASTSLTISSVPTGTYYYTVTAFDTEGRESVMSAERTLNVN